MNRLIIGLFTTLATCTNCLSDSHVAQAIKDYCVYIPPEKCYPLTLSECIKKHDHIYLNSEPGFYSCPFSYEVLITIEDEHPIVARW